MATAATKPAKYPAWGTYFAGLIAEVDPEEVQKKLGISTTLASRWARGSARPADMKAARKVATALDGDPEAAEKAIRADSITVSAAPKARKRGAKKTSARTPRATAQAAKNERATPPAPARQSVADPLTRVQTARQAFELAERELDHSVTAARNAGLAWPEIAQALN